MLSRVNKLYHFLKLQIFIFSCPSCTPITIEETDNQVKIFDDSHVQKKGRRKKRPPLDNDNNHRSRKTPDQENKEKNWKILYQNYLQVAVLTNANLWSFAPQGLSKFGHLADGSLDLILIEPTTRKDFIRCVKRNGNSKNQVEIITFLILKFSFF